MTRSSGWRPIPRWPGQRLTGPAAVLVTLLSLPGAWPALAKSLYKYQDASGAWVFTDRPPATDAPVEVRPLPVQELPAKVSVRNRGATDAPTLTVINDYYGPIEVEISGEGIQNMEVRPSLPARMVAPARAETPVVSLRSTGPRWRYAYRVRAVLGDPTATHNPDRPYAPPFAPGQRFPISQAFNGTFSHQHPQSRYAVDIGMPLGTPVRAAREGVIMEFAADFLTAARMRSIGSGPTPCAFSTLTAPWRCTRICKRTRCGSVPGNGWNGAPGWPTRAIPAIPPAHICTSRSSATPGWNWFPSRSNSPVPTGAASRRLKGCC